MPRSKKTYFKSLWTQSFPWVEEVPGDKTSANCSWCHQGFSLSNMGKRALMSHGNSQTHLAIEKSRRTSCITQFFSTSKEQTGGQQKENGQLLQSTQQRDQSKFQEPSARGE